MARRIKWSLLFPRCNNSTTSLYNYDNKIAITRSSQVSGLRFRLHYCKIEWMNASLCLRSRAFEQPEMRSFLLLRLKIWSSAGVQGHFWNLSRRISISHTHTHAASSSRLAEQWPASDIRGQQQRRSMQIVVLLDTFILKIQKMEE
mgnify:CR=1 FL=1